MSHPQAYIAAAVLYATQPAPAGCLFGTPENIPARAWALFGVVISWDGFCLVERLKAAVHITDRAWCTQIVERTLMANREMLRDYFSLEISDGGELMSIPLLLKGYTPSLAKLPGFLLRLGPNVSNPFVRPSVRPSVGPFFRPFFSSTHSSNLHSPYILSLCFLFVFAPSFFKLLLESFDLALFSAWLRRGATIVRPVFLFRRRHRA
jgi:hypothetical protein